MRRTDPDYERPRVLYMPRTRGAVSGLLLILLGSWGALIPFIGPIFNWAYGGGPAWTWTVAEGWLEVLPGVATAVGGLLVLFSGNRASAMLGGWLAVFGGAWFVVGRAFASTLRTGDVGQPVAPTDLKRALLDVTYFTGLGALIVFLGGAVLALVAVRHARDVAVAAQPAPVAVPAQGERDVRDEPRTSTPASADQPASAEEPRRRTLGGLFRRHRHAGV